MFKSKEEEQYFLGSRRIRETTYLTTPYLYAIA